MLVCPQGFVADHLEVLYDLDTGAAARAAALGLAFARTRSLNDDPVVLAALAERVRGRWRDARDVVRRRRRRHRRAGRGLGAARGSTPTPTITVYEPGRLGGKLLTTPFAGRLVDEGADAFLARVPWGRELCDELGLGGELVSPAIGAAPTWPPGRALHRLPDGLVLGVPTDPTPCRAAAGRRRRRRPGGAEPARPARRSGRRGPEHRRARSAAGFGDDVLERLVDPLLGGINAGDSDRLSVRAAAPQLAAAAERSASLVGACGPAPAAADRRRRCSGRCPAAWRRSSTALVGALEPPGVRVRAPTPSTTSGDVDADGVVLATPARATAVAASGGDAGAGSLRSIGHASPVLVTFAFGRADVRHPLDASGFLVPRAERPAAHGVLVRHHEVGPPRRRRPGTVRAAGVGRPLRRRPRHRRRRRRRSSAALLADLDELLGLDGDPIEVRVSRWRDGFPQYEPGHLDRVAAVEADVARPRSPASPSPAPRYRGIGIPACIRSGRAAARAVTAGSSPP